MKWRDSLWVRMYYFGVAFGVVLGTIMDSWIYALLIMNLSAFMTILEVIWERKHYGGR